MASAPLAHPLSRYSLMETDDVDAGRQAVSSAYRDHLLEPAASRGRFHMELSGVPMGGLSFNVVGFGAEVRIDPEVNDDFFVEHFALRGRARIEQNHRSVDCSASCGVVVSATKRLKLWLGEDCLLLGVKVSRAALELQLSHRLGERIVAPVEFQDAVDLHRGAGGARHRFLWYLMRELDADEGPLFSPLCAKSFEESYLDLLLSGQAHNYSSRLAAPQADAAPWQVKRVEEYLTAHAGEPVSVGDLVEIAGVSATALYAAFRKHRGYTPMQFLRATRLDGARDELAARDPSTKVTDVAIRWGFHHLSRFARDYRKRFGENPSETLEARARRQ